MARRRMFSLEIISSDKFLGLSTSAQSFYFHLNMHADDEGFVAAPRSLAMLCGGSEQDLQSLEDRGFVIRFDSGVLVIVHWLINNTIRKDRSMETMHRSEKAMLQVVDSCYVLQETNMATKVTTNMDAKNDVFFSAKSAPQNRIEENRIDDNRIDERSPEQPGGKIATQLAGMEEMTVYDIERDGPPSLKQVMEYFRKTKLYKSNPVNFWMHYNDTGWTDKNGEPVKDWKALAKAWDAYHPEG